MKLYQSLRTALNYQVLFFSEFGNLELSQKFKDDIAYLMTTEGDWRDICKHWLPGEEERIECDNRKLYDQAYNVICLLIERGIVSTLSDMEHVLNPVSKAIMKTFKEKYKKSALAPGWESISMLEQLIK